MATEVEKRVSSRSGSRMNEIVTLIVFAVTILLFFSLISYNANDPTIITASPFKTQNWIGVIGANAVDILFSVIGLTAYLLPAMLVLIGWRVFRAENLYLPPGRVVGFSLLIVSISGLLSYSFTEGFRGGMVGAAFLKLFLPFLGSIGTLILLFTFLLAAILLITNFSYIATLGGFPLALDNFKLRLEEMSATYKSWREKQKAAAEERRQKQIAAEEKREKEKLSKDSRTKENPTISNGDNDPAKKKGKTPKLRDMPADISIGDTDELLELEEPPLIQDLRPKIIVGEEPSPTAITEELLSDNGKPAKAKEEFKLGQIPITPVKKTGDLTNSEFESFEEETDQDEEKPSYENYLLPTTDFLTPAPPRIEQKEEELLDIANNNGKERRI